ncbi:MAG: putative manganese transporter [Acidobacteriota bacterium]|jgi:hypothetical protein
MTALDVVRDTILVTAFVGVMMVAVEYLHVLTRGAWPRLLATAGWIQVPVGVLLGTLPGCLGSFAVVALYSHRMISFGALVGCMIATSGDEAFVMLALFPERAVEIMLILAAVGLLAGVATDRLYRPHGSPGRCEEDLLHAGEDCRALEPPLLPVRPPRWTLARGALVTATALFVLAVATGGAGPERWSWLRWTLLLAGSFGCFVSLTAPQHFLEEHLWRHVALRHVPQVFLWTLGALAVTALIERLLPVEHLGETGRWLALGAAALLGLIPESGPHLLVVTLFDRGVVPLSVLLTSSIVQDGHGMLPLLAWSRADFLRVKAINLAIGLAVGAALLALGR